MCDILATPHPSECHVLFEWPLMYKKFKNSIDLVLSGLGLGVQMPYCTPLGYATEFKHPTEKFRAFLPSQLERQIINKFFFFE